MHGLQAHWERVTPVSLLLYPLSLVFGAAAALRRASYRAGLAAVHRLPVPVIVVGNITAGGSGKTPLVLWLCGFLREHGRRPGIVSRGYGGTEGGPSPVAATSDPGRYGDEPVLLARRSGCPVWIGADRAAAGRGLLAAHPDCDVIVGDDGLQHYGLARDLEICVIDTARGFGNGWLLPAGPLREPPSRLAAVDAVVFNGAGAAATEAVSAGADVERKRRFRMTLEGREFQNLLNREHRVGTEHFRGQRVHAIAGLGDPARFFRHLQGLGLDFTAHPFSDHHPYRPGDVAYPDADAIVMTEKDAVKCLPFAGETHWVLPVDAAIPHLGELVLQKLGEHRG